MIFAILLTVLIEIFDAFAYFVFPLIPSSVLTVIDSIFTYLTSALNWVFACNELPERVQKLVCQDYRTKSDPPRNQSHSVCFVDKGKDPI